MHAVTRRQFLAAALGTGTALALGLPLNQGRAADRKHSVAIATLVGENKPETQVWHYIRDQIETKLPGRFQFRIVPNAALGSGEKEIAEGIRLGSIQGSVNTTSVFGGWVPQAQIFDLPFLFKNREHLERVLEGEPGKNLKEALAGQGFVALGYVNYGVRYLMAKQAIDRPEGLAGKRVRSIPNPVHTEMWKAFQAQPVSLPISETYNALSTGVVEAMDLNKSAYAALKLYEVVPYLIETEHIWASGAIHVSEKFWSSLNDEEKEIFAAAAARGARHFNDLIIKDEELAVAEAGQAGGRTVPVPDRAPWEKAAAGVWEKFAADLGGLDRIVAIHNS
jgi:tripartite ATP-independent transporter DctP family solute receptor